MIKKLTAFSFILIASFVLLAHAVIPHYHHQSVVCIEQRYCHDDSEPLKNNIPEHEHQHDGNTNSSACVLKQASLVPTSQGKHLKNCNNCSDNHNHDFYILSNFGFTDKPPISKVVTYFPLHSSYLITFVTSTPGLRAPPIV